MTYYQRKILSLIIVIGLISSIAYAYYYYYIDTPINIPLNDIESHRLYQDSHSKERVLNYYEKLLKENKTSAYASYYVARLLETEDANRAENLSYVSIRLDSTIKYNYIVLARIYNEKGNFSKCLKYINKAQEKGMDQENISYEKLVLLSEVFSKITNRQIEQMVSNNTLGGDMWSDWNMSFRDFFYEVENDFKYLINNHQHSKSPNDLVTEILALSERYKLIKDDIERKKTYQRLCSEISHKSFVENRYSLLGKKIIQINLINQIQECVYMWRVVCITEYGTVSNCNILTGLSDDGSEIAILTSNCN